MHNTSWTRVLMGAMHFPETWLAVNHVLGALVSSPVRFTRDLKCNPLNLLIALDYDFKPKFHHRTIRKMFRYSLSHTSRCIDLLSWANSQTNKEMTTKY